jgi:hypothetical protein
MLKQHWQTQGFVQLCAGVDVEGEEQYGQRFFHNSITERKDKTKCLIAK